MSRAAWIVPTLTSVLAASSASLVGSRGAPGDPRNRQVTPEQAQSIRAEVRTGVAKKPLSAETLQPPRITIWVHNHTRIKPSTLARSEREATRILGEAGVDLVWNSSSPPPRASVSNVPRIHVSIVKNSKGYSLSHQEETLGIAPMLREGERDTLAEVFLDRIRYQADHSGVSMGVLLGHVISHELGHLLLRTSGHASTGIMCARWTPEDLRLADSGQLLFTPQQADQIRKEVRERAQQLAAPELVNTTTSN